jgi:hypothetical protein
MRFVIEVPDELLRGATATAAEGAPPQPQLAPLSGGVAADGASQGDGALAEALSAGPAEGGGVQDAMTQGVMALDGGAAPE